MNLRATVVYAASMCGAKKEEEELAGSWCSMFSLLQGATTRGSACVATQTLQTDFIALLDSVAHIQIPA